MTRRGLLLLPSLLLLLALPACGDDGPAPELTPLELVAADGRVAVLQVEVADTAAERRQGLSDRASLDADQGMLFVIEGRGGGFWMKDTSIPLSIAFVDGCGFILDVQEMEAYSLDIHQIDADFNYGLEASQGWFAANGIGVGDRIRLSTALIQTSCP